MATTLHCFCESHSRPNGVKGATLFAFPLGAALHRDGEVAREAGERSTCCGDGGAGRVRGEDSDYLARETKISPRLLIGVAGLG